MRTFSQQPEATEQVLFAESTTPNRAHPPGREADWMLHLQRTMGNRATQRMLGTSMRRGLQTKAEGLEAGSSDMASPRFAHDSSRIPARAASPARTQTKLMVSPVGDIHEQEADAVSERVMRMPEPKLQRACACGAKCPKCKSEQHDHEHESLRMKRNQTGDAGQIAAPPIVHEVLASPGQPIDAATRAFMEPRFGRDFGQVRLHTDERAAESARAVNALAYTVGSNIVFGSGQYAPETQTGKRLLAHELSHVEQQRESAHAQTVQRSCYKKVETRNAILSDKEEDYIKAVREGKYCMDTGATGVFHEGRCYREIPPIGGFPPGDQVCFEEKTGRCAEDSPDVISAVEGQNPDGSCNLDFLRSIGHFAEDIFPSEPGMVGAGFGLLAGTAIGYTSNLGGSRALGTGTGALMGIGLGAGIGLGSRPLAKWMGRRGFVPTLGTSLGMSQPFPNLVEGSTWQASLYVGAAKRDRAILKVFYPEFKLGVTLVGDSEGPGGESAGMSTLTSLMAGIRIDPGQAGGHYLSFFGGPALSVSSGGMKFGTEAGFAVGKRWRFAGVFAHASYVRDPARDPAMQNQLQFGLGFELAPERP